MAFKQSNNPISRKTSPLRSFTMGQLNETTTAEAAESKLNAKTLISKDDPKRFAGDDEGRLQHQMSPEEYDDKYTAPSRKASPLNDKTGSKTIGQHMMTATKHAKHVSTVHARHKDTLDRVQENKEAAAAAKKEEAPSRKASPLNNESKGNMKKTLVDKPPKPVPPVLPKATNESPKPAIERAPNKPYKKPPSRKTHKK